MARLRGWWWRHVRRYRYELCRRCGRPVSASCPTFWHAPDALWLEVEGSLGGIRCIPCFTTDCEEKDIHINWRAVRDGGTDCWCTWDEIDGHSGIVRYHPRCPQHLVQDSPQAAQTISLAERRARGRVPRGTDQGSSA